MLGEARQQKLAKPGERKDGEQEKRRGKDH